MPMSPMSNEEWLADMTEALGIEPEDVLEVAAMFFEALDDRLAAIDSAYRAGNMSELLRLAHGLKGDAANMRFHDSSQLARELEMQIRAGQVHDFEGQLATLRQALARQKQTLGIAS